MATPVIGEAVFSHSSGIHLTELKRDAATYEAFPPESVGHASSRQFFGVQSGPGAWREFARQFGIALAPENLPELAGKLREFCRDHHTTLVPAGAVRLAASGR